MESFIVCYWLIIGYIVDRVLGNERGDEIEIATLKVKWKNVVNEYKDELSVLHKDLDVSDEDFDVQMIWDGNYHLAYALFKLKDF